MNVKVHESKGTKWSDKNDLFSFFFGWNSTPIAEQLPNVDLGFNTSQLQEEHDAIHLLFQHGSITEKEWFTITKRFFNFIVQLLKHHGFKEHKQED